MLSKQNITYRQLINWKDNHNLVKITADFQIFSNLSKFQ
uniref:Uncharacterized protein n=1 Tax=Tetranychus urticae TaxID=32264 RepID=T1JSR9_TETUR